MIEEQALYRVHRVGQKRSVTTIRYLMKDSFEEVSLHFIVVPSLQRLTLQQQVVEIQKRKKLLAKVTFGQDSLEIGIGMSALLVCLPVLVL